MNAAILAWMQAEVEEHDLRGARVLDVGSLDVNGSPRSIFTGEYIGIDLRLGPGVDEMVDAADLGDWFAAPLENSFDLVICSSMLEHATDWRAAMRGVLAVIGIGTHILFTAPMPGFPIHEHPGDYWRIEPSDVWSMFPLPFFHEFKLDIESTEGGSNVLYHGQRVDHLERITLEPAP